MFGFEEDKHDFFCSLRLLSLEQLFDSSGRRPKATSAAFRIATIHRGRSGRGRIRILPRSGVCPLDTGIQIIVL